MRSDQLGVDAALPINYLDHAERAETADDIAHLVARQIAADIRRQLVCCPPGQPSPHHGTCWVGEAAARIAEHYDPTEPAS